MSANEFKWHLQVYSEDEATRQLANGLRLAFPVKSNCIQIMPYSNGWTKVVKQVKESSELERFPARRILMIIDFDEREDRLGYIQRDEFFQRFAERLFILWTSDEVECLKELVRKTDLEDVGQAIGKDCTLWKDDLLKDCMKNACRLKSEIELFLP